MSGGGQAGWKFGSCKHDILDNVLNEGGAVIARRCHGCARICCHVGTCDGCGKPNRDLFVHKNSNPKARFCNDGCRLRWLAARANAKKEAARLEDDKRRAAKKAQATGARP